MISQEVELLIDLKVKVERRKEKRERRKEGKEKNERSSNDYADRSS